MKKLIDIFGKEVETGDIVILPVYAVLEFYQVLKINEKTIKLSCKREISTYNWGSKGKEVYTSLWTSGNLDKVSEHNSFVYKQIWENKSILKIDMKDLVNPDNIKSAKQLIKDYKVKHNIT